eukprot:scaffold4591_cov35-Phaeocystis_antarctica.AAC.2
MAGGGFRSEEPAGCIMPELACLHVLLPPCGEYVGPSIQVASDRGVHAPYTVSPGAPLGQLVGFHHVPARIVEHVPDPRHSVCGPALRGGCIEHRVVEQGQAHEVRVREIASIRADLFVQLVRRHVHERWECGYRHKSLACFAWHGLRRAGFYSREAQVERQQLSAHVEFRVRASRVVGEIVLVGAVLLCSAHRVQEGLGPRCLHVFCYVQVTHSEGVPRLHGGASGQPPSAAKDESVGVLLQGRQACFYRGLAAGGCEPEGGESLAHQLPLRERDPASAAMRHGARVEAVRCHSRLPDVVFPRSLGSCLVTEDYSVPLIRQSVVHPGGDVVRARQAPVPQRLSCLCACLQVKAALPAKQEHHRL